MDIKEEEILGDAVSAHWYYVAKGLAMRSLLGDMRVDDVLDVGAGSGVFARQLLSAGVAQAATCVDPGYAKPRSEIYEHKPIRFVREVDTVSQGLILLMDVLEHVDDDLALLQQYTQSMPDSARVFITVPAFQMLWSGHDVFLGHRRRYTLSQVEGLIRNCGLRVLRARYFYGSILRVRAWMRTLR